MRKEFIELGDGAGGELMQAFIKERILSRLRRKDRSGEGIPPSLLDDSATVGDMAFTVDGHTVWPLEFPGGDIGSLSVAGTVNDLAVVGARPEALSLSLVLEEGLNIDALDRIISSIGATCEEAGVEVVTGDTKVVENGGVRGMVISTSGIGRKHPLLPSCLSRASDLRAEKGGPQVDAAWLRDDLPRPGDIVILSGSVGDHGISLLSFREGYGFETEVRSDIAPLNHMMEEVMKVGGAVAAKDLTRGGLANGVNEWASKSGFGLVVREEEIPVKEPVRSACDMLGLDPFEIGNEGKLIICVAPGAEEEVLKGVRMNGYGRDAVVIGEVVSTHAGVILETEVGGKRIMDPPHGDPIPRIC